MEFEYKLTAKDFHEATKAHFTTSWNSLVLILAGLLIVQGLLLLLATNDIYKSISKLLTNAVIFISIYFGVLWLQRFIITITWSKRRGVREPIAVEVSEEGISTKTTNTESRFKWPVYVYFRETPNLFMLYQSPTIFNVFPKRAFISDEQIAEFRELLGRKVKKVR